MDHDGSYKRFFSEPRMVAAGMEKGMEKGMENPSWVRFLRTFLYLYPPGVDDQGCIL